MDSTSSLDAALDWPVAPSSFLRSNDTCIYSTQPLLCFSSCAVQDCIGRIYEAKTALVNEMHEQHKQTPRTCAM